MECWKLLSEGIELENIEQIFENVTIINFNYDRCVEHFFYHALQLYFRLTAEEAAIIVNKLKIYHPYGSLGNLPWQGEAGVEFGAENADILALSDGIKTFTEKGADYKLWQEAISEAKQIVFLGFAYYEQNMELLKLAQGADGGQNIYGTAYKMSDANREIKERILRNMYRAHPSVHLNDLTAVELLKEYSERLKFN